MRAYLVRRILLLVFVVWGVFSLTFLVTNLTGDPVTLMMNTQASRDDVAHMKHLLGLDRPLHEQYLRYLWNALHGDFGMSFRHRQAALPLVMSQMPHTILLALAAISITIVLSFPLGALAALKRGTAADGLTMVVALIGQAMPSFWLGILLLLVFGLYLDLFPVSGAGSWRHLVLPAFTVAAYPLARSARLVRSSLLEVLGKEYITTARSKGLSELTVLFRHALRNALIPVLTVLALDMSALLGGAVVVETIFGWPGVGRLLIQAIQNVDFPVIQAGVTMVAMLFVVINLAVDILYTMLDPRIRYS